MKFIYSSTGGGKTTELIKLSAETGGYIVCRRNMCKTIQNMSKELGYNIPFPLSYEEFLNKRYYRRGVKEIYIDDIESLLSYMSSVYVDAITFTTVEGSLISAKKKQGIFKRILQKCYNR